MATGSPTSSKPYLPGITPRSLVACVVAMLVMGMYVQYCEVILADSGAPAEMVLPIPMMAVFTGLLGLVGALAVLARFRLLTRAELFCVFFAMVISTPIMTQGMWHRFLSLISTIPRTGSFSIIDAYNDKLWPHGENLLDGAFTGDRRGDVKSIGNPAEWVETVYGDGITETLPILVNTAPDQISAISVVVPLEVDGKPNLVLGEPYLVSFLVRAENLGSTSRYFCRVYYDDDTTFTEVVTDMEQKKPTFLHKEGFVRVGNYGVNFEARAKESIRLELGLSGQGRVELADAKLFSVAALEGAYRGKRIISASDYANLPPEKQVNLIVKPDNMWSVAGLAFLFKGYIPVRDWWQPAVAWSTPILLLLAATMAIVVAMRRQWAESERYPFPNFQIPYLMLGGDEESDRRRPFAAIWSNGYMWAGLIVALSFGMLKAWHLYNPTAPNLGQFPVQFKITEYAFKDPKWGGAFNGVEFKLIAFFVGIALFFEINVLFSLVLGFLLFRLQYTFGQTTGTNITTGYPLRYHQAIGAYLGYFVVVVFFTRKYLADVLRQAAMGMKNREHGEVFTYRIAFATVLLSLIGMVLWASWLDVAILPMMLYFVFLLVLGFISAKFRAECGLPVGYFTPYNAMLFVSLLGGMSVFGAEAMMICLIASGFLTVSVFFFIPGAQLEMVEYGRRFRIQPRHLTYTAAIGALGGLFIGGWVFLSNAYALGGDNIVYQWAFSSKMWFFGSYNIELAENTALMTQAADVATQTANAASQADAGWLSTIKPTTWAYGFGGVVTIILAVLRQYFAGFWFHPIGFILGSAHMMEWVWGSCGVALVIRWTVLKLGGAATVKTKLMPFAAGLVLGATLASGCYHLIAIYMRSHGVETIYTGLP